MFISELKFRYICPCESDKDAKHTSLKYNERIDYNGSLNSQYKKVNIFKD